MAPQGAKKVDVAKIADKRMNTLTLTVTMDGKVLPYQAIYKEKQSSLYQKLIPQQVLVLAQTSSVTITLRKF